MALSDQLGKLAERAEQAEMRAVAAQHKAASDLRADVAAARASAQAESQRLRESADAGRGEISDRRLRLQRAWSEYTAAVRRTIDEANAELDLAQARRAADTAESDASYAIDYAYAMIEQAESDVLHAEFARMKADDLEAAAHAGAQAVPPEGTSHVS